VKRLLGLGSIVRVVGLGLFWRSIREEFVVGKHGIILTKGRHQAVFLPQVAPEQGWDKETTLMYLAQKAGLRPSP